MPTTTGYESVHTDAGEQFDAYCAVPDRRGPGIIFFQEFFGINNNMRDLAERLANLGYVTVVPDMFWRIERRFERNDESDKADGMAMVQKFDFGTAPTDIDATHRYLLAMAECNGRVGVMGFCLGGTLAFAAATTSRVDGRGPDAAVCYYGSMINDMLDGVDRLECPALFHYGDKDPFIPPEKIAEVEKAVAGRPRVEIHHYDAGHAFSNGDFPSVYVAAAAELAWSRTLDFLRRHIGPGPRH